MENNTPKTTGLGLVDRILAFLQLGEDGKINAFFIKQVKRLKKDISNLEKNISTAKEIAKDSNEEVNEKIEDLKEQLNDAFMNISVEDVKTNELANDFEYTYWNRIAKIEADIKYQESIIEATNKKLESDIKGYESDIADRKARIAKIEK